VSECAFLDCAPQRECRHCHHILLFFLLFIPLNYINRLSWQRHILLSEWQWLQVLQCRKWICSLHFAVRWSQGDELWQYHESKVGWWM
jgi:hypothetical protein